MVAVQNVRIVNRILFGMILWSCLVGFSLGAMQGGQILGRITDASGIPLPGVQVIVKCADGKSFSTDSDGQGFYRLENLPPGNLHLRADLFGFLPFEKTSIPMATETAAPVRLDFRLSMIPRAAVPSPSAIPPTSEKGLPQAPSAGAPEDKSAAKPASAAPGSPSRPASRPGNIRRAGQAAARNTVPGQSGESRPFQNMTLQSSTEGSDNSTFSMSAAQSSEAPGSPDASASNIPSEAFLINGSINFGVQGAPQGPGGDFMSDPRFQLIRERLGIQEPGQPGEGFFQNGIQNGMIGEAGRLGGSGGAGGRPGPMAGGAGARGGMPMGGGGFAGGPGRGVGFGNRMNRPQGMIQFSLRNSALDARPYSLTGVEQKKQAYANERFGGTLGGPLKILFWKKSRQAPFYMINYSGQRGRNSYDATSTVPLAEERQGDFSASRLRSGNSVRIYDPASPIGNRSLFPNSIIPANRLDSAALGLLKYLPLPNQPGLVQNYFFQESVPTSSDQLSVRVMGRWKQRNNINISYAFNRSRRISGNPFPDLESGGTSRGQNFQLQSGTMFRRGMSNQLQISFNRNRNLTSNRFSNTTDVIGELGILGLSRDPINYGIPTILLTNYGDMRLSNPSRRVQQTVGFSESLRILQGKHSWSMGFDYRHTASNRYVDENSRGTFQFSGLATSDFDAKGNPLSATGLDFADFLLGLAQETSRRYGGSNVYLRSNTYSGFLSDDWRALSRLTVNAGIRYEYAQPPTEKYDHLSNLDINSGISAVGVVLPGGDGPFSGKYPRSLVDPDRNNFAPRIGLAYRPSPRSNLVLRAGYGIFYNLNIYDQVFPKLAGQPPFAVSQNLLTSVFQVLTLKNGFPEDPSTTVRNSYAVDRHYRIGYVQSWNLNIQKNLKRSLVLNLGYIGTKGTRLDLLRAPNRAPSGSTLTTEQRRRIEEAGNFILETSGAASAYHALQMQVSQRFARGVSLAGSYTWSKSIDNAAGIGGGQLVVQDDSNFRAERGLSSFDVRHRANLNGMLDLPFGPGRKFLANEGLASRVLSGWTFTGNATLSSGAPFTARILGNAVNNSGTGGSQSERADATGMTVQLAESERTLMRWFNTAAFQLPKPGTFGNAGRNTIAGPGSFLVNMSATKDIRLDEKGRSVSFVWQANNVFNRPNFSGLSTVVNSSTFGRITQVQAMRSMNFSLRFRF